MVDAKTTSRWYFVIAMGRKAGHLALGIGKAAGATLTLDRRGVPTAAPAEDDRRHAGRRDHQAPELRPPRRRRGDRRGRGARHRARGPRRAARRRARRARPPAHRRGEHRRDSEGAGRRAPARQFGIKTTIVAKNIGYELRCADPIPFDMEYTRDLGYCAAKYLLAGGNAAMISMQGGHFVPVPFHRLIDRETGRDARPPGRHHLDALRDRAALHDPAAPRRLRGSARARQARRDRARARCRSSAASSSTLAAYEPPPILMDEQGERPTP